uniref:Uncharacterized protein n=1 Tax=Glossina austeni TaxID=7395 RepID=A0A1A9UG05_GLOAU
MNLVILSSFFIFVRKEFSFSQSGGRCSLMLIRKRITPPMMSEGHPNYRTCEQYVLGYLICEHAVGKSKYDKRLNLMRKVDGKLTDLSESSIKKCYSNHLLEALLH